jgi:integrase
VLLEEQVEGLGDQLLLRHLPRMGQILDYRTLWARPTTERTDTALIVLPPDGTEIALSDELIERTKDYMAEALSQRTRDAYSRWQRTFASWCERHGRQALPASPETIAAWLTSLADGQDGRRPLARASINQALAAVTLAHRLAGHAFDRKHRVISMTWSGISRVKAMTEVERQAAPVIAADVVELLVIANSVGNIGCRNAALLTLGWGAALRRSELVGLDWELLGTGTGFVRIDERGILITLARSKASQDKAETVVIPRADLPEACEALEDWAARVPLKPGEPIFRAVNNRQQISAERLTAHSVSRIEAMRDLTRRRGKSMAETKDLVRRFSGHSLRAGYATSAAAADVPALRIQQHTRHKSADMVARYVRESDKWSKSGLRGVLRRTPEATDR